MAIASNRNIGSFPGMQTSMIPIVIIHTGKQDIRIFSLAGIAIDQHIVAVNLVVCFISITFYRCADR